MMIWFWIKRFPSSSELGLRNVYGLDRDCFCLVARIRNPVTETHVRQRFISSILKRHLLGPTRSASLFICPTSSVRPDFCSKILRSLIHAPDFPGRESSWPYSYYGSKSSCIQRQRWTSEQWPGTRSPSTKTVKGRERVTAPTLSETGLEILSCTHGRQSLETDVTAVTAGSSGPVPASPCSSSTMLGS